MDYRPAEPGEREAVATLLVTQDFQDGYVDVGETWVARDADGIVGTIRLIDVGDGLVYVADVVVAEPCRGTGIGSALMRKALAARDAASFFLVCHPERLAFYGRLGFEDGPKEDWPAAIVAASRAEDDFESDHDELHHFMSRPADGGS